MNGSDNPRVLVVDDEPAIRRVVKTFLERKACEVHAAGSAEEALERLAEIAPNVALLDIVLPGMNGLALFDEIVRRYPGLPVIMMTSHGCVETVVAALRRGAVDYLEKPFDGLDGIWAVVEKALERRTAAVPGSR